MKPQRTFPGRVGLQQRVLPTYRASFFDVLAANCEGGLSIFAGSPRADESITTTDQLRVAHYARGRNYHFFNIVSPFYICWQGGLLKWLNDWQPDILIVEANPRYKSIQAAVEWMHRRNRLVIGWGLGAPPISGLMTAWRKAERNRFLTSLDGFIAYSRRGAQEYHSTGLPPGRIFVALNAAAHRPTEPPPKRPPDKKGSLTVLFVGRLQARKRIDLLLQACSLLPQILRPRLWIVGDGPERESLQDLAKSIYPSAEFPGSRTGPDLEPYFTGADLFVLPGTGGLAVQQAMAYGLPVIVAEGDGTQDDLVRENNGWRIPPGDLTAMVEVLSDALSDVECLRRMGVESYRLVVEEVNLEAMVDVFIEALCSVTGHIDT